MAVNLSKYRTPNAQKVALEILTPVREDKAYTRLRRAFAKATDKWVKAIQSGTVRAPRGNPENFFNQPHKRWIALGRDGRLVTVPKSGVDPVDRDLVFVGSADETVAFLGDLKTAANEGQFDDRFKELASGEPPRRRRRRSTGAATAAEAPKPAKTTAPKRGRRSRKAK